MKNYSDEKRKKNTEKKLIFKDKIESLVYFYLNQNSKLKEFEIKETNYINQLEDLKFQLHLLHQDYIKQKAVFKDIMNLIKEKDNTSVNLKLFKENLLKKIESVNDDYKEVLNIIN